MPAAAGFYSGPGIAECGKRICFLAVSPMPKLAAFARANSTIMNACSKPRTATFSAGLPAKWKRQALLTRRSCEKSGPSITMPVQSIHKSGEPRRGSAKPYESPPINQSARLAAGRCSCYVRSVGCEEHDMRLMMQGLTDAAFEQRFGAEDACLAALAAARQAAGMACPRCGNPKSYVYGRRVSCTRCNQRWSVTSGTVMADTKLPLTHWFRAMHLMTSTKQGISAIELGRRLGVSYPTAWDLHKRLRRAMTERGPRLVLGAAPADACARPTVEADDVYLGGERNQGRGTAGKTRVIAACERQADGAMGYVVMKVVASFTAEHVAAFRDAHIAH